MAPLTSVGIMPNKCTTPPTHSSLAQFTLKQLVNVGFFGICDDAANFQMNYLIDEIVSTGKGANSSISYVHHYLENFSTDVY